VGNRTADKFGIEMVMSAEAEFLDVIGTKSLRVFLLAIHTVTSIMNFNPPSPLFETV